MPRPDRTARPVRRRLLAPIASLTAAAGIATVATVLIGPATPAAAAVVALPVHTRILPTLPLHSTAPTEPVNSSPATQTSAAVGISHSSARASTGSSVNRGTGGSHPKAGTFSPEALPTQAPASSAAPCLPDTKAPGSGADLELPQIAGSSDDPGYSGWLRVNTVGPDTMLPPQLVSSNLATLQLTRTVDAQSENLAMAAGSGDRFACARLDVATGPGRQRVDYALTNAAFISEYQQGQTEYLTLTYSRISWNYLPAGGGAAQTGSGAVNAKPNQESDSVRRDAKLVGAGVIGLTLLCTLGMVLLTLVGRHRRKLRYREVRERSRLIPAPQFRTAQFPAARPSPPSPAQAGAGLAGLPRRTSTRVAEPSAAALEEPQTAALPRVELPVPEVLRAVKVTQFAHTRTTVAAVVAAVAGAGSAGAAEPLETSAPEPDAAADRPAPDGEVGADPVDPSEPGGQDEPGELAAEVDPDGEAETDGGGGEELVGPEDGLAPDDEQDTEIGGGAGQEGDEPGDGVGEAGGGLAPGEELPAEPEQDAGDGDGDGLGEPGLAQGGVADPGEGGAEDGVAEDRAADLEDDREGEPEDGGGEGLEPGPGGDDEGAGRVEVDAEGDPGAQHDADPADDADDDEQDLEQPGGGGEVEAGEGVLDGGDERAAGEQGEEPAGDDGRGQDGGVDEV